MDHAPHTLSFPPLLRGHKFAKDLLFYKRKRNSPPSNLVSHAIKQAEKGELSAGDILWSSSTKIAHCAIILEPEITSVETLSMVPLAMVAIADSLGAISPPNVAITFGWPDKIYANGARVGAISLYCSPSSNGTEGTPDFAVISIRLNISWQEFAQVTEEITEEVKEEGSDSLTSDPGNNLANTVLHEEGCGEIDSPQIIESWARHFLTWMDSWEHEGFKPVHENWLFRANQRNKQMIIDVNGTKIEGQFIGLDEQGGALLKSDELTTLIPLKDMWSC